MRMSQGARRGMGDIEIDGRMAFDQRAYYADHPDERAEKLYVCAVAGRSVDDCPAVNTDDDRRYYQSLLAQCEEIRRQGRQVETLLTRLD